LLSAIPPIINLAFAGLLDLLPQLYGEISIPEAVWNEIVVRG
jgi:predicted nucleic acid-binding protein